MDGLIVFAVVVFTLYRLIRRTTPEQWQEFMRRIEDQQKTAVHKQDSLTPETIDSKSTRFQSQYSIYTNRTTLEKTYKPFQQDRWRTQLFIVSLLLLLGFLVYLALV